MRALTLCLLCAGFAGTDAVLPQDTLRTRVPPGQRVIQDFPLLHYSSVPELDRDTWRLKVAGSVKKPVTLTWADFCLLPQVTSVSDCHCVTGWTRLDNHWKGVRIRDVLAQVEPLASGRWVSFFGADNYKTSLPLSQCTGDDDILAFAWEGRDLVRETGGPVRAVVPGKYAYKGALWVVRIEVTETEEEGYWESRGYSRTADPWTEDRYVK
jgi:DMSO/TMAO reductase YedYZ molybdopterin-dependent catalytic subunit